MDGQGANVRSRQQRQQQPGGLAHNLVAGLQNTRETSVNVLQLLIVLPTVLGVGLPEYVVNVGDLAGPIRFPPLLAPYAAGQ